MRVKSSKRQLTLSSISITPDGEKTKVKPRLRYDEPAPFYQTAAGAGGGNCKSTA